MGGFYRKINKNNEEKRRQMYGKDNTRSLYAQTFIVVAFLVVNFFGFFGHNSEPHHAFWTKIGGNLPLSLPELPIPIRDLF